jgi:hypothetical protein
MAKIKQIGGSPRTTPYDAKDILIWLKCLENKNHPSYLITPYDVTQNKLNCPLCEGREVIIPYQIKFGIKLNNDDSQSGVFGSNNYFTIIKEAKDEVKRIFDTVIKEMFPNAIHNDLIMITDLKCDCGSNISSATYDDGIELVGRMDGKFNEDEGEFYIEIVKVK